jgi:hypothetical protein
MSVLCGVISEMTALVMVLAWLSPTCTYIKRDSRCVTSQNDRGSDIFGNSVKLGS